MLANRTTLILGAVAAVLFAYIVFVDEGTLSTSELEGRSGRVVERFVRSRVKRLDIRFDDVHLEMVRDQDVEEDMDTFDVGTWTLTEPVSGPADVDAVDALLSAIEWLEAEREIGDVTGEDRTQFGLDEPRVTLVFEVATETHTLRVGSDEPLAHGVYVQIDDDDRVFVVGRDLYEALTHDVDHYRSKDMFPDFRTADVTRFSLAREGGTLALERSERRWYVREPVDMLARDGRVDELLRALRELRAERFVAEAPEDAHGLGDEAAMHFSFAPWPEGSTHFGDERPDVSFAVGAPCPEHPSERLARVDEGPVVCVAAAALELLGRATDEYRELRLVSTPDDDVERIVIEGASDFTLTRAEGDWELLQGETTVGPADPAAIAEWVAELREPSAASFVPFTDEAARAHGLEDGEAITTLTIHRTDDDHPEVVRLGASDDDGVWVRRGDEAQLAQYPLAIAELLTPPAIRFRSRTLVARGREDLASVVIERATDPGHTETLHQEGSAWVIETPAEARADAAAAGDLADALAPLSALRFVASAPSREHGLDAPRFVIRASFDAPSAEEEDGEEDEHDHDHGDGEEDEEADEDAEDEGPLEVVLRIGAATEGGAFAQLDGSSAVFVVAQSLVDAVDEPLLSRDVLSIAASEIASITFVRPIGNRVLSRTDAGWQLDGAAAASEPTLAMLDALAGLRASGVVRYGEPGAHASALTLRIEKRDGAVVTLSIGLAEGEGDAAFHVVWREPDVPAGLRVPPSALAAILGYAP